MRRLQCAWQWIGRHDALLIRLRLALSRYGETARRFAKRLQHLATRAFPIAFEGAGIGLLIIGAGMIWRPLAFIVAGGFIVWISEAKS